MLEMYEAKINSPTTHLTYNIDANQTTINVQNTSVLPDAPNLATIGTGEDAETILYNGKTSTTLTGITRGFEGDAKPWPAGTKVGRYYTAYDHNSMKNNIGILNEKNNYFFEYTINRDHLGEFTNEYIFSAGYLSIFPSLYNIYLYTPKNGSYKIYFYIHCYKKYTNLDVEWRAFLNNIELAHWIHLNSNNFYFQYNGIYNLSSQRNNFRIKVKCLGGNNTLKYRIRHFVFTSI